MSKVRFFKYLFIFMLFIQYSGISQKKSDFSATFTRWYNDKPGAISVTFDDASYTQYEYAYPVLERYKIKATFSLVGEWTHDNPSYSAEPGIFEIKKMGWRQIRELSRNGHEIAAHGYVHRKYGKRTNTDILAEQMTKIKSLIESKLKKPVYTLHYPYSFTSDSIISAAKKAGFLFGRTQGTKKYNTPDSIDFYLLASRAIMNDTNPGIKEFVDWVNNTKDNWLILMYHHLFPKGSLEMNIMQNHNVINTYSLYPATFESQMSILASSDYWIAPVAKTGKYIKERKHTKIKLRKHCRTIKIKTITDLDPEIYDHPLTVKVTLPWKRVRVKGSENDGIYKVVNNQLLVNVMPGKTVKIKKK